MIKRIVLHNQGVEYTLQISQRARCLRLAVYHDGNFVVTAPRHLTERSIEKFITKKSRWVINKLEYFKNNPRPIFPPETKKDYSAHKEGARGLVQTRLEYFNQVYGFKYNRVSIRNQKTRWGSCSIKGNLNFNYKIASLPARLADYIIVHELCHLKELNHSVKFWDLVARMIPDYLAIRKDLKKSGVGMKMVELD